MMEYRDLLLKFVKWVANMKLVGTLSRQLNQLNTKVPDGKIKSRFPYN